MQTLQSSVRPRASLVAELVVMIVVTSAGFWRGGVPAGATLYVSALAAVAFAAVAVSRGRDGLVVPLLAWALFGGAGVALVSSIPLPVGLGRLLSPRAVELAALHPEAAPSFVPWSLDPTSSLLAALRLAAFGGLVTAAATLARRDGALQRLAGALSVSGVFLAVVALWGVVWGGEVTGAGGLGFLSPYVNPNHLANLLTLAVAASCGLALSASAPLVRLAWAAFGVSSTVLLVATRSNGGVIGLAVMALLFLVAAVRRRPRGERSSGLFAVVAAMGAVVVLAMLEQWSEGFDEAGEAAVGKSAIWPSVIRLAGAHAWTGVGAGAFESAFPAFAPPRTMATFTHPENLPLQWLTEWGAPLGLVGLLILGKTLVSLLRERSGNGADLTSEALAAGAAALVLHDLGDFSLEFVGVGAPFMVAVGVVAGAHFPGRNRIDARVGLAGGLALACLTALFAVHGLPKLLPNEVAAHRGEVGSSAASIDEAWRAVRRRHVADPYVPLEAATALLSRAQTAEMREERADAIRRALPHLARAQVLSQGESAHALTAEALWLAGRRAQAFTELRAAYVAALRPLAMVRRALQWGADENDLAAFPIALLNASDGVSEKTSRLGPVSAARQLLAELWTQGLYRLARRTAELLAVGGEAFSSGALLADMCEAAERDAACHSRDALRCSPAAERDGILKAMSLLAVRLDGLDAVAAAGCRSAAARLGGDLEAARAMLAQAISARPENVWLRVKLAQLELDAGRPASAVEALRSVAPEASPELARDVRTLRILGLLRQQRAAQAITEAEAAVLSHPGAVWPGRLLAQAFEAHGELSRAALVLSGLASRAEGAEREELARWRAALDAKAGETRRGATP